MSVTLKKKSFSSIHEAQNSPYNHYQSAKSSKINFIWSHSSSRQLGSLLTATQDTRTVRRGWIGVCKSALNFRPESEIRAKIFVLHAKSKIRAQKNINESAFCCSCRILKSVRISLWIRNPGKNIFKIRRSVRLFTRLCPTLSLPIQRPKVK